MGVDLGGTHVRVLALDGQGRARRFLKTQAPADLPSFLRSLWKKWGFRGPRVVVSARGVWTEAEKRRLQKDLAGLGRVSVTSDVEAAHSGALGGNPGLLISAGTGSIVFGTDAKGRRVRRGGLGPLLGDEGSGFWLGREYLKRSGFPEDRLRVLAKEKNPVAAVTGFAKIALVKAGRGNPLAKKLVREAQIFLAGLASAASRELRFSGPIPLSWSGGLMEHPFFRNGVLRRLPRKKFQTFPPRESPVVGAAHLALKNG